MNPSLCIGGWFASRHVFLVSPIDQPLFVLSGTHCAAHDVIIPARFGLYMAFPKVFRNSFHGSGAALSLGGDHYIGPASRRTPHPRAFARYVSIGSSGRFGRHLRGSGVPRSILGSGLALWVKAQAPWSGSILVDPVLSVLAVPRHPVSVAHPCLGSLALRRKSPSLDPHRSHARLPLALGQSLIAAEADDEQSLGVLDLHEADRVLAHHRDDVELKVSAPC